MKKIMIVLIILFYLLSSAELFSAINERINYKIIWDSWSKYEKYVYLWGLKDGLMEQPTASSNSLLTHPIFYHDSYPFLEEYGYLSKYSENIQKVIKEERSKAWDFILQFCLSNITIEIIRDVTTDLYKDPSNSYIYISDMCYLAFWKIKGENIESILIKLRKEASE